MPKNHFVSRPAREAYSHSASVGSRASCPVFSASFAQNSNASGSPTLSTGQFGALVDRLTDAPGDSEPELWRTLHKTIKKVTEDIETLRFNTAISQMMVFTNEMTKLEQRPRAVLEPFLKLLAPFAPHLAEELWERLGLPPSVGQQSWPQYDISLAVSERVEIPVQING